MTLLSLFGVAFGPVWDALGRPWALSGSLWAALGSLVAPPLQGAPKADFLIPLRSETLL